MMSVFSLSVVDCGFSVIITPSRTHNLPHSRRTHSSLHNGEPTIYHTRGEYTHHYTIENPQSTTLDENTLIITPSRTHNLPHSRRKHSLHHREPTIYYTPGEHTHHYTIENPQSTTLEENTLIFTPSRTYNLPHSRRIHSSLHVGSRWCNDECVLLECGRLWVIDGVMMSVFSSSVVDCGFAMV
jgi:hypothetical protein